MKKRLDLQEILRQIDEKQRFDPINNADSQYSRQSAAKAGTIGGRSLDGKEIKQILGIEDEEEERIAVKQPLKMMDIVLQTWDDEMELDDEEEED